MDTFVNQSMFIYILAVIICAILIFLISWFLDKQQDDSKKVRGGLYYELDKMMYYINGTISKLSSTDTKFEDLIYVIYAKKKRFLEKDKHDLNSWYEFWLATRDGLNYLESYTKNEDIFEPSDLKDSSLFFDFLYKLKTVNSILKTTSIILLIILVLCMYMIVKSL